MRSGATALRLFTNDGLTDPDHAWALSEATATATAKSADFMVVDIKMSTI